MPIVRSVIACSALLLSLYACTPQQALVMSLIQSNPASTLLGNLQGVGADNRKRIAELDTAGRWDELARFAETNLENNRAVADWWIVKGYALSQVGENRNAASAYGEAVRLEPDSALAWNMLAQSHRAAGDPQRAVVVLERAMLAVRDVPTTPFLLGESYSDLTRYDDAAAAYRQALGMDPKFTPALFGLSRAYARLGRSDEARQARNALEKLDPKLAQRLDER